MLPEPEFKDVRNKPVRARDLYAFLSLADLTNLTVTDDQGNEIGDIQELNHTGVLSATREIANIHLIYGNEFLVDALDYRFSADADTPNADDIFEQELSQLGMAFDILVYAFSANVGGPNPVRIGDYFTGKNLSYLGLPVSV